MKKILVTGGAGYIGSHTAVELLESDYEVVIIDNFYNSKPEAIENIKKITNKNFAFYEGDVRDKDILRVIFNEHKNMFNSPISDIIVLYSKSKDIKTCINSKIEEFLWMDHTEH